jgi:hypothetical protein
VCVQAVLSHTWGDEEVLFADIYGTSIKESPAAKAKSSYSKIVNTCLQVAKSTLKLDYCWIDTCCINKDSSSELSEAINSMYIWYSNAEVCYALLEDVERASVDEDLPAARWFTRGWTLQELLAPRKVEFYDKDWAQLGIKDTESDHVTPFLHTLKDITGIDEVVLWKPAYMRSKSVAARMSWAHNRQTSRSEDLAYCLMGIFDVNMPLLYGEGSRAFVRLQEEIIKLSDDHSIFAWDRDLSESSAASCLASDPSWFRRGAYVVPFGRKQTQSSSYSITNQGVQIRLRLLEHPTSGVVYGLINCHWENTLTSCIGIPLRGSMDSQFFERSSQHQPENIPLQDMARAKIQTVFLSIRPPVEFPFAAEVTLQVYDNVLKEYGGFFDVEVTDNPLSSHNWHPDYDKFTLRWPSSIEEGKPANLTLLWRHESRQGLCLSLGIKGRIDGRQNDGLGYFTALELHVSTEMNSAISKSDELDGSGLGSKTETDKTLTSSCLVDFDGANASPESRVKITAHLRRREIFGNEVYICMLDLAALSPPKVPGRYDT